MILSQRARLSSSSSSASGTRIWNKFKGKNLTEIRPTGKNQIVDKKRVIRFGPILKEHGTRLNLCNGITRLGAPFDFSMWGHGHLTPHHQHVSPDQHLFGHLEKLLDPVELLSFDDLMDAGGHHGHRTDQMHPKMADYIFGERRGFHVIDLYNTISTVRQVCRMAQYMILNGGQFLWVCFDERLKPMTDYYARISQQPYMIDKWRPGFFTNHEEVFFNSRTTYALDLSRDDARHWHGQRKIARRQYLVNAYAGLKGVPSAVFLVTMKRGASIIKEAETMQIPCIGIVDTDCDPTGLSYPIPLNDENQVAMGLVLKTISACMKDAMDYRKRMNEETGILFDYFPGINFGTKPPHM